MKFLYFLELLELLTFGNLEIYKCRILEIWKILKLLCLGVCVSLWSPSSLVGILYLVVVPEVFLYYCIYTHILAV